MRMCRQRTSTKREKWFLLRPSTSIGKRCKRNTIGDPGLTTTGSLKDRCRQFCTLQVGMRMCCKFALTTLLEVKFTLDLSTSGNICLCVVATVKQTAGLQLEHHTLGMHLQLVCQHLMTASMQPMAITGSCRCVLHSSLCQHDITKASQQDACNHTSNKSTLGHKPYRFSAFITLSLILLRCPNQKTTITAWCRRTIPFQLLLKLCKHCKSLASQDNQLETPQALTTCQRKQQPVTEVYCKYIDPAIA